MPNIWKYKQVDKYCMLLLPLYQKQSSGASGVEGAPECIHNPHVLYGGSFHGPPADKLVDYDRKWKRNLQPDVNRLKWVVKKYNHNFNPCIHLFLGILVLFAVAFPSQPVKTSNQCF